MCAHVAAEESPTERELEEMFGAQGFGLGSHFAHIPESNSANAKMVPIRHVGSHHWNIRSSQAAMVPTSLSRTASRRSSTKPASSVN